jgi:hypothetical protein
VFYVSKGKKELKMRKTNRFHLLKLLATAGYMLGVICLAFAMVLSATPALVSYAQSGSGAIWTTLDTCGDPEQNVNHYQIGDIVYINGANFDPVEALAWDITRVSGNPKETIATGTLTADGNGAFCIAAYTIEPTTKTGTYQTTVGEVKSDNFRIQATDPTPTNTAVPPTNTAVPTDLPTNTSVPPTDTPVPTDAPTNTPLPPTDTPVPTDAPTNTPVPTTDTPVPTDAPTNTPLPSTDTPVPTDAPTNTPVPPTDTPIPTDAPTNTPVTPTDTPVPTATLVPETSTAEPQPTQETPTSLPPTVTPDPTDPPPPAVQPTDLPPPQPTSPSVLIPVTGLDLGNSLMLMRGLFSDLGFSFIGFGLLMHGAWLRFGKENSRLIIWEDPEG